MTMKTVTDKLKTLEDDQKTILTNQLHVLEELQRCREEIMYSSKNFLLGCKVIVEDFTNLFCTAKWKILC